MRRPGRTSFASAWTTISATRRFRNTDRLAIASQEPGLALGFLLCAGHDREFGGVRRALMRSWLRASSQRVVPATAGIHTPCRLVAERSGEALHNNRRRWLWVPAFAGTNRLKHQARENSICDSPGGKRGV